MPIKLVSLFASFALFAASEKECIPYDEQKIDFICGYLSEPLDLEEPKGFEDTPYVGPFDQNGDFYFLHDYEELEEPWYTDN